MSNIDDGKEKTTTKVEFQVYTQRWYMLASYSILSCSSAWIWITWAPIAIHLTDMWNVSFSAVDALSGVYMYVYVPGSFIVLYLVVNYLGLRNGLLVGAIFNCFGALLRYTAYHNYTMVYIGTLLCAVAQAFTLSTPPLIAGTWFGANERGTATSLGILANQLGTGLGLGATAVLDIVDTTTVEDGELDDDVLFRYLRFQFVITCIAFIALMIFAKDQPPTPPNAAAYFMRYGSTTTTVDQPAKRGEDNDETLLENKKSPLLIEKDITKLTDNNENDFVKQKHSTDKNGSTYEYFDDEGGNDDYHDNHHERTLKGGGAPTYYESICILVRDYSSVSFVVCFGLTVGVYYAIPTFLSQLMPNSWSARAIGWLGLMYQVLGVLGSFLAGIMIDMTKEYRKINVICLTLSFVFLFGYYIATYVTSVDGLFGNSTTSTTFIAPFMIAAAGAALSAFNTAGVDLGTGITFPADDAAVAGILEAAAELNGFLCVTIGGLMADSETIDADANQWTTFLLTCIVAIALLLLLTTKTDMKRPI